MKCAEVEVLFSDYLENELPTQEAARVAEHLEGCGACHAGLEALRYALGDLQSLSLREAQPAEVGAIMAAVDRAQAAPIVASRRPLVTHLVAAGIGAWLVWLAPATDTPVEPEIVERVVRVEVPVEVERIVEVPVEVERIVEVEVPVEVPVPVEVERIVRVPHPLQLRATLLEEIGRAFVTLADAAATKAGDPIPEAPLAVIGKPEPARVAVNFNAPETPRSAVHVVRSGDRVSLRTRGSTEQVVPALIAMLSSEDPRLRRVIEERLEGIRGEPGVPGADQVERDLPDRSPRPLAGLKALISGSPSESDEPSTPSSPELWRTWWETRSTELAALDLRSTY